MKSCTTFKTCVVLLLLGLDASAMAKERNAKPTVPQGNPVGYVKRVYDPFAGLDFSYNVIFNKGQERDTNLQGASRIQREYHWGNTVWSAGGSFALVNGHLVVIHGSGTTYVPGRMNTAYSVSTDARGKQTIAPGSLSGDVQISAQNRYAGGNTLWESGTFKVASGQLVIANGSLQGFVRGPGGLDFTYRGTSGENGKTVLDPASLRGQTEIHGLYAKDDDLWSSGTFKIIDGQLIIANGSFEHHVWGAAGLDFSYRGTSDENGKTTIDPASLLGQAEIRGEYVIGDDVWKKGTFKIVDGQLVAASGLFEQHTQDAGGADVMRAGTSDENGKTTVAMEPTPPTPRAGGQSQTLAGLYQAELPPNPRSPRQFWAYLRLYSDGTAVAAERVAGTGAPDSVARVAQWLNKTREPVGSFEVRGTTIEISVGDAHFQGQVEGTTLILDSGRFSHRTYHLVLPGD